MTPYEISRFVYKGPTSLPEDPHEVLREPYYEFSETIDTLKMLNRTLPKISTSYFKSYKDNLKKKIAQLDSEGKKEYERYMKWVTKEYTGSRRITFRTNHKALSDIFNKYEIAGGYEMNFEQFIRKMGLVYLVMQFNEFLKSSIGNLFMINPEKLKSPTQIIFTELFDHKEIEGLQVDIAYREADQIIRTGIESINKFMKTNFKLNLRKDPAWKEFTERFYRRNIMIHNNGVVNKQYRDKTGYEGKEKQLFVTSQYLSKSIDLFDHFGKLVWTFLDKKYFSTVKIARK